MKSPIPVWFTPILPPVSWVGLQKVDRGVVKRGSRIGTTPSKKVSAWWGCSGWSTTSGANFACHAVIFCFRFDECTKRHAYTHTHVPLLYILGCSKQETLTPFTAPLRGPFQYLHPLPEMIAPFWCRAGVVAVTNTGVNHSGYGRAGVHRTP